MLDEGCVHLLASDAHDTTQRPQNLAAGYECASKRVGGGEAEYLVLTRPMGVLKDQPPSSLPGPLRGVDAGANETEQLRERDQAPGRRHEANDLPGLSGRLRRLLKL